MPAGLKRFYGKGQLHFITFSCYRRLPLLKTARARDVFVKELSKIRDEMGFHLIGDRRGGVRRKSDPKTQVPKGGTWGTLRIILICE
jgi:hypothetical protein